MQPTPLQRIRRRITISAGTFLIVAAFVVVGIVLFANQPQAAAPGKQAKLTGKITVQDTSFEPSTLHIKAGSTVTWLNTGTKPHQIAADPFPKDNSINGFDNNLILKPKDTLSFIFSTPGTYHYHDELHPLNLLGTIVVDK